MSKWCLRARARACGVVVVTVAALTWPAGAAEAQGPWMDPSLSPDARASLLIPEMTLTEKVDLMTQDPVPVGAAEAYFNKAIPRIGLPDLRMADIGPGVRFLPSPTTAFPMGLATAATWNPALAGPLGGAVAKEARLKRQNMILGPNVDIPRNPWWGRTAESFGEDPLLSGLMASRFVRGAQAGGKMAVNLKHYNLYTQETNRGRPPITNSVADERTLQEIYTRPWAARWRRTSLR